jgi:NAD(P)H-dependent flavin oxidoreductase YrpB (nitropropane dioxygenase family)
MTITPSDAPPASYETRFTRLVGCRLPIQSAPMAGVVSDAGLPAAVAAAGGHGMFPALFLSAPYLTRVISDLSGRTRAYGVNFIGLMLDRECLEIAAAHAPLVELFLAEPSREIVETIHAGGALASYQVASDQQALRAQDAGADLLVVQGIEAGGHPAGDLGLLPLLEEVLAVATVPVVAAGGIGGPRAVAAVLAAGADAARAGTRFVAAAESRAHARYKQALVEAGARDAVLTRAFSAGDPVETTQRVLRSALRAAEAFPGESAGEVVLGGARVPVPRFGSHAPTEGSSGAIEAMALYAGQSAGGVTGIVPAVEIVTELASRLGATALAAAPALG